MIKRFALLTAALLSCTMLHGAPVGNTSAPDIIQEGLFVPCDSWLDIRAGYEGDFVADGRMKQYAQSTGRVDTFQQWTNSGTVTINVVDRVDIYGIFGSSKAEADWRFGNLSSGTVTRIELESKYSFLWGAGGRAILYEWCRTSLGLGGRYSSCHYQPDWLTSDGLIQPTAGSHFSWREWQINLDISYKIDLFTPYIGLKYSNAQAKLKHFSVPISQNQSQSNSFENRIPVGLYLGCALSSGKFFMLNLEGRVIDEEAVTISGDFRF